MNYQSFKLLSQAGSFTVVWRPQWPARLWSLIFHPNPDPVRRRYALLSSINEIKIDNRSLFFRATRLPIRYLENLASDFVIPAASTLEIGLQSALPSILGTPLDATLVIAYTDLH